MNRDLVDHSWAVIMAGGSGTRFWPLSRRMRPKQLLPLSGTDRSLLRETVDRIAPLIPKERVVVVTAQHLAADTRRELPQVPDANILAEPIGRNTAPCVGWAASHIRRRDSDALIAVLAADHHIADEPAFHSVLRCALETACRGDLVTVGITPTRPETGYGYLELGEPAGAHAFRAQRFVEKPSRERAELFQKAGNYLWNSGMFFFRASAILDAIREHLPELSEALVRLDRAASEGREGELIASEYGSLPAISIDHGVMEKAERVMVVTGDFGWSDVGSWMTAWELATKDEEGNSKSPDAVLIDTEGCYVRAPKGKVVAMVGVRDLVVVDTEDAILVVPRERAQDVRAITDELRKRRLDDKL